MAKLHGIYVDVGRAIADLRRAHEMTQEELAERAGIETSYLARIESGQRRVTLEKLVSLARVLEVPVRELFPAGLAKSSPGTRLPGVLRAAVNGLPEEDVIVLAKVARALGERRPARRGDGGKRGG